MDNPTILLQTAIYNSHIALEKIRPQQFPNLEDYARVVNDLSAHIVGLEATLERLKAGTALPRSSD